MRERLGVLSRSNCLNDLGSRIPNNTVLTSSTSDRIHNTLEMGMKVEFIHYFQPFVGYPVKVSSSFKSFERFKFHQTPTMGYAYPELSTGFEPLLFRDDLDTVHPRP